MTEYNYVPATDDVALRLQVAAVIRDILTVLATLGVVHGAVSDSVVSILAGVVIEIGSLGWALWERAQQAKKDRAGSVQSAALKIPVRAS